MEQDDRNLKTLLRIYEDSSRCGYCDAWLSSDGELIYAVNGHAEFSQRLHNLPLLSSVECEHMAHDMMYSRGFIKVTISREDIEYYYKGTLSIYQFFELMSMAEYLKIPLYDERHGKIPYSPYI